MFVNKVNGVMFDVPTISRTSVVVIGKPEPVLRTSDVESNPLYPHHGLVMTATARWGRHQPGHSPPGFNFAGETYTSAPVLQQRTS